MRALVILGVFSLVMSGSCSANQVDKVVSLLQDLHNEVSVEREADAKTYNEFACFCRDQMSEKVYMIDKSSDLIDQMTKKKNAAEATGDAAEEAAGDNAKNLSKHKGNIASLQETRKATHAAFLLDQKKLQSAIDATKHAIKAIKDSQSTMSEAKIDLISILDGTLTPKAPESTRVSLLETMQEPHTYVTQGATILGLLQELMDDYISQLNAANDNEINHKRLSEEDVDSNERGRDIEENSLDENQAIQAEKEAIVKSLDEKITLEKEARKADKKFLADLNSQCEQRAKQYRENDSTRAQELSAFTSAIEILNEASGNQDGGGVSKRYKFAQVRATNFLQLGRRRGGTRGEVVKLLQHAARSLGSSDLAYLSMISIRAGDPFIEVRSKIQDLMSKLENQVASEKAKFETNAAEHKKLDDNIAKNEENLESLKTKIASLKGEIATNEQKLKENKATKAKEEQIKAEREALNAERSSNLRNAAAQAKEGKEKVEQALQILTNFFDTAGEKEAVAVSSNVPEVSSAEKRGRDGKSMADLAPSSGSNYQGAQNRSKGVLGMLETILDDFTRSEEEFKTELSDEKADYAEDLLNSNQIIQMATEEIDSLSSEIDSDKGSLATTSGKKEDETDLLKSNKSMLATLHKSVNTGENFEKEKERRTKEIEALKEALSILETVGGGTPESGA